MKGERAPLICKDNWLRRQAWLGEKRDVDQSDVLTLRNYEHCTRHLLEWLGPVPIVELVKHRPTFPQYLLFADLNGDGKPLSNEMQRKVMRVCRQLVQWIRLKDRTVAREIPELFLKSWVPARNEAAAVKDHAYYSLEQMLKLLKLLDGPLTARQHRDLIAAIFMFLSGMRIGAFITMRVEAVILDGDRPFVRQYPALGMKTKGRKAADTWLWQIPELLAPVREWDNYVRSRLPSSALWYAGLDTHGRLTGNANVDADRRRSVSKGLRVLCQRAGIPYLSVHKLRHGHAMYGINLHPSMDEYKAISTNLMHSSMQITDTIYGTLRAADVGSQLAALSARASEAKNGNGTEAAPAAGHLSDADIDRIAQRLAQLQRG